MSSDWAAIFAVHHAHGDTVRLLPREEEFFALFTEVANRNKEAVEYLRKLFEAPPDRRTPHIEAIKRLEHEADQVTHEEVVPAAAAERAAVGVAHARYHQQVEILAGADERVHDPIGRFRRHVGVQHAEDE